MVCHLGLLRLRRPQGETVGPGSAVSSLFGVGMKGVEPPGVPFGTREDLGPSRRAVIILRDLGTHLFVHPCTHSPLLIHLLIEQTLIEDDCVPSTMQAPDLLEATGSC